MKQKTTPIHIRVTDEERRMMEEGAEIEDRGSISMFLRNAARDRIKKLKRRKK